MIAMLAPFLATLVLLQTPAQAPVAPTGYTRMVTHKDGTVEMQTAAQRLVADGKPVIWLVGAIHVGSKPYYASLQRMLNYQDAVYYEGVRANASAPTMANRPKPAPDAPTPTYKILSDALGLDFQMLDIDYTSPKWTNVDLTMEDLDRLNKDANGGKPNQFDQVKSFLDPKSQTAKQLATVMGMATPGMKEAIKLFMIKTAGSAADAMPGLDPATQKLILIERNKAVVDALSKTFADPAHPRSIGVFYGAAHLADLQRTLVDGYGYRLDEKRWFGAATADPKKVDATAKMLLGQMEGALKSTSAPAKPAAP